MAVRFKTVLQRKYSQGKMENDVLNPKDSSRPLFVRPLCTVGIYLDAVDAKPDKNTTVGSHHAFMMDVMDKMLDYLRTVDLAKVKGTMETKRIGSGAVLEGFKHDCILAVTFDTSEALESLWALHAKGKLTAICQDMFVDKSMLKETRTSKIVLRAKMWEDEYSACKEEILSRPPTRLKLSQYENDLAMVQRVKNYQQAMPDTIVRARDYESAFEHNLGEFMLAVKRSLPQSTAVLRSVKEFHTNIRVARGVKKTGFEPVDHYMQAIEFFRKVFAEVEANIVFPLCQVRAHCENEKQQNLKKAIKDGCAEMAAFLKPEADLGKICYKDWEMKVLKREQGLFYGLISLVPMGLDRLTTIDVNTDEYIMDFVEMAQ
ncbi:unnamed protein product [Lymnaea stagnalis]|uniref:Uncharacterized protein n=1 Tax=Lymnaea stagnalis TaxID=6523 RepID=A0AAV2HK93_LYMST